jgi:hypothetical protein
LPVPLIPIKGSLSSYNNSSDESLRGGGSTNSAVRGRALKSKVTEHRNRSTDALKH